MEVTQEKYRTAIKDKDLELASTFTDTEGNHPLGFGCPAWDTEYNYKGKKFCRIEIRNYNNQEEITYYLF